MAALKTHMNAQKLASERARAGSINEALKPLYPDAVTALKHANALQLLVATILSAQCTDARVNLVTPALFTRYKTARDFATCDIEELETLIKSTGFYKNKAKNIRACCREIVDRFGGEVPPTLEDLVSLPGVGRKTANVVLGDAFGTPGITVDTHVGRLSRRLGPHEARRPGEGRVRADGTATENGVDRVQSSADPARPRGVSRPQPAVRGVRARTVPEGRGEEEKRFTAENAEGRSKKESK